MISLVLKHFWPSFFLLRDNHLQSTKWSQVHSHGQRMSMPFYWILLTINNCISSTGIPILGFFYICIKNSFNYFWIIIRWKYTYSISFKLLEIKIKLEIKFKSNLALKALSIGLQVKQQYKSHSSSVHIFLPLCFIANKIYILYSVTSVTKVVTSVTSNFSSLLRAKRIILKSFLLIINFIHITSAPLPNKISKASKFTEICVQIQKPGSMGDFTVTSVTLL